MKSRAIYTLANDKLYDQVIALINSIRRNYNQEIPIIIIPYDDNIEKLKKLELNNVSLFDKSESFKKWQNFAAEIWNHESFQNNKQTLWYHGSNTIRKLCCFDGDYEKFLYIDSDELVMSSLEDCFDKLDEYDCIFDDWEHNKSEPFLRIKAISSKYKLSEKNIRQHCHCSDFFAANSSLINEQILSQLKSNLLEDKEIEFINQKGWWDEVYLFSYITFKLDLKIFNYTLSLHSQDRTGSIAGVDPFVEKDYVLVNQQGLKPIHRIHYMGYKAEHFTRLCQGENTEIPHQQLFLYYRFLNEPEKVPRNLREISLATKIYRFGQKVFTKLNKF